MRHVQSRNTITEKNHEIFHIGISMFFFGTNSTYTKVHVEFVPDNIHPTNHGNILTNPNSHSVLFLRDIPHTKSISFGWNFKIFIICIYGVGVIAIVVMNKESQIICLFCFIYMRSQVPSL